MNPWKNLEEHLRSWKPRPASARIRWELFAAQPAASSSRARAPLRPSKRWMAPAMAFCAIGAALLSSPEFPNFSWSDSPTNHFWEGVVLTNPTFAAYIPGDSHSEHNQTARSVQGAVGRDVTSPLSSFAVWKTNRLMR